MSERKDGGAAFPGSPVAGYFEGMSLRDWFAGQTLGYYIASMPQLATYDELAEKAYRAADAMLKARQ